MLSESERRSLYLSKSILKVILFLYLTLCLIELYLTHVQHSLWNGTYFFCTGTPGKQNDIDTSFWTTEEKMKWFWTLGPTLLSHTTWLFLTCLLLKRNTKNYAQSHKYTEHYHPLSFAHFAMLQNQWNFMLKIYTKYFIRVRRKFYKFGNAEKKK